MTRNIVVIGMAAALIAIGNVTFTEEQLQSEPALTHSPVQVIRPQMEILDRPVIIEVQVEPTLGADTSMRILCATSNYRGSPRGKARREDKPVHLRRDQGAFA